MIGPTRRGDCDEAPCTATAGLVISREHGGNLIPSAFAGLFAGQSALLASHRGFDAGALRMAKTLAEAFAAPLVSARISRLLVDLNRSPGHPTLHHPCVRDAPTVVRRQVMACHYAPYRRQVAARVAEAIAARGRAIHLSSHSFTPALDGDLRRADIGLLYDPSRTEEALLCARWKRALGRLAPALTVRRNYPYRGSGDGLTSALRRRFAAEVYLGIELELNQKLVAETDEAWAGLRAQVVASLRLALPDGAAGN